MNSSPRNATWTAQQNELFEFTTTTCVNAGAGSGKTASMVELLMRLVTCQIPGRPAVTPERLVAITFTDKAAAEMRERMRTQARERGLDADLRRDLDRAQISTIHGFAGRLLREVALDAGLDPEFQTIDELASRTLRRKAVEQSLIESLDGGLPDLAELASSYALSAGGKGSGLIELVEGVVGALRSRGQSLATLRRPPTAPREEASSALVALGEAVGSLVAVLEVGKSTSQQGGARALAQVWTELSQTPPTESSWTEWVERLQEPLRPAWKGAGIKELKESIKGELLGTLESAVFAAQAERLEAAAAALVERVVRRHRDLCRSAGGVDFDDLQALLLGVLQRNPVVLTALRERFDVIMVDEFQDTNPQQWDLVRLLASDSKGTLVPGRLFVVGDPKQSIYGFRGADVGVFTQVMNDTRVEGGRVVPLTRNFRSRRSLLELVNGLFSDLMTEPPVVFGPEDRLEAHREGAEISATFLRVPGDGGRDAVTRREARAVALTMRTLSDQGHPWSDMALLLSRFTVVGAFSDELRRARIPFQIVKGRGFARCPEVLDLYHGLALLDAPHRRLSLVAVLRGPLVSLSDALLTCIMLDESGLPRVSPEAVLVDPEALLRADREALESAERGREWERLRRFAQLFRSLYGRRDALGPTRLLRELIDATGLEATLASGFQGAQKVANVRKLLGRVRTFEGEGRGTRSEVLAALARLLDPATGEAEAPLAADLGQAVSVMTIHQSKGLEFPVVFVGGLGLKAPPDNSSIRLDPTLGLVVRPVNPTTGTKAQTQRSRAAERNSRQKSRAESLRLLYVAMTRARDRLVLSGELSRGASDTWHHWIDGRWDALSPWIDTRAFTLDDLSRPPAVEVRPSNPWPVIDGDVDVSTDADAAGWAEQAVNLTHNAPLLNSRLMLTATGVEDLLQCPRRFTFIHRLGLEEPRPPFAHGARLEAEMTDAGARDAIKNAGILAHALMEIDATSGTDLGESLRRVSDTWGDRLDGPTRESIVSRVESVLSGPLAALLGLDEAGHALRELPFTMDLPGLSDVLVKGQIDLVVEDSGGPVVVDFKYRAGGLQQARRYATQLTLYAWAVQRGRGGKQAGSTAPLRARVVFLGGSGKKDDGPSVIDLAPDDLDPQDLVDRLRVALSQLAGTEGVRPTHSLPVLDRKVCTEIRCGFVTRCHSR